MHKLCTFWVGIKVLFCNSQSIKKQIVFCFRCFNGGTATPDNRCTCYPNFVGTHCQMRSSVWFLPSYNLWYSTYSSITATHSTHLITESHIFIYKTQNFSHLHRPVADSDVFPQLPFPGHCLPEYGIHGHWAEGIEDIRLWGAGNVRTAPQALHHSVLAAHFRWYG